MTCPAQGPRPVVAQIRGDIDQPRGGTCRLGRQCCRLEFQHLGLVDFVDSGSVGPAQAPCARIQSGAEDDRLADAAGGGRREKSSKKDGTNR